MKIDFQRVYVSTMDRAKESGNIIASILGMMEEPEADELLNEGWKAGSWMETRNTIDTITWQKHVSCFLFILVAVCASCFQNADARSLKHYYKQVLLTSLSISSHRPIMQERFLPSPWALVQQH